MRKEVGIYAVKKKKKITFFFFLLKKKGGVVGKFANWLLVVCEIESVRRDANIRMADLQSWNFVMVEFRKGGISQSGIS